MNAIGIEPNQTIATNQFDPKADFAPNELSLAIAQNTRQELMIIKPPMGHKQESDTPTKPGWTQKVYLMMAKSLPLTPSFGNMATTTPTRPDYTANPDKVNRQHKPIKPRCNEPTFNKWTPHP